MNYMQHDARGSRALLGSVAREKIAAQTNNFMFFCSEHRLQVVAQASPALVSGWCYWNTFPFLGLCGSITWLQFKKEASLNCMHIAVKSKPTPQTTEFT